MKQMYRMINLNYRVLNVKKYAIAVYMPTYSYNKKTNTSRKMYYNR